MTPRFCVWATARVIMLFIAIGKGLGDAELGKPHVLLSKC